MSSHSAMNAPLQDEKLISSAERSLIEELDQIVTPFAQATNTAVAYISGAAVHWLADCHECLCSQSAAAASFRPEQICQQFRQSNRSCHSINLEQGGVQMGRLAVCCKQGQAHLSPAVELLVRSINRRVELEQEQELLMEELSTSWESLEAVYEISSDVDLLVNPQELIERIINRAVSFREGLKAVLWIEREGTLHPHAKGLLQPEPRRLNPPTPSEGGLIEKVMFERNGIVLNGRDRIALQNVSAPEFQNATNLALAPLTSSHGSLGALAVWQEEDHGDFDSQDMRFLGALALQAAMVVENDRLHRASIESERLRQEVEIGSKIQQTLLMGQVPGDFPGLKVAAISVPSQMIDGDFYDFIKPHDRCLDVISGDVMGKGIPAALVGAATKTHFLRAMNQLLSSPPRLRLPEPQEIVACAHAELVKQLINLESFVTICYARFDLEQGQVRIVDCGHTRTVRYRQRTGECDLLQGVNLPIGFSEWEIYEQSTFELEAGDLFIFYSDGLTEAMNAAGESFGEERLVELITGNAALDPKELVAEVHRSVITFAGKETLADDLTCVAVKIMEAAQGSFTGKALLELLSDPRYLEPCRAFVRRVCHKILSPAVNEEFISQLELAVNEAVTNVMLHAYQGRPDQPIQLVAEVLADRIIFRLRHQGASFDPNAAAPPVFDGTKSGGFGLFIIAQSVDEVSYTPDALNEEYGWNCISLTKKFTGGSHYGSNTGND